jgi:signal transduction histidine kinase
MNADLRSIKILTVDDSEEDSKLHEMILAEAGFSVTAARSAREAREILKEEAFNLLIVDLQLEDGAYGIDLLEPARLQDPLALAVIVTGFASTSNAIAALKAQAYDFISKPCPADALVASVERAAEKYFLSAALQARTEEIEDLNRTLDRRVRDATQEIFSLNEKLKRYISDLVEANNDQTRALEEMAHELKNPLSVIIGYSGFLLKNHKDKLTESERTRSLQSIQKNAGNLQELIEELLDAARLSSRKIILSKETFHAKEALEDAIDGVRLMAEEAGIVFTAECEEKCPVNADKTRLRQILINLITNAIKHTPRGGRVSVSAKISPDGGVLFTVEDTGSGIEPEQAKRIFERFYQVPAAHGRESRGLGLGLNIVEGLVRLHKGRVWVDSEPGIGSKFFVFLPEERVPSKISVNN